MSRKRSKRKGRKISATVPAKAQAVNVPRGGQRLIATAQNDVTIPFYSNVLELRDPTVLERGRSEGVRLYNETLKDGRTSSTFEKRVSKVTRREWIVDPASEDAVDVTAAEGIREILSTVDFDKLCKDLLRAIFFGYAVSEIVWWRNQDGLIAPRWFADHDCSRFRFDKNWNLRLLTRESGFEGIELPNRKFIVHRHNAQGNNPYGLGLGSVVFWHVLFKRDGASAWLTHLEKFASPIPFGKFPAGTAPAEQDRLLNHLLSLVRSGALVAPIGTELEFLEAKRAGDAGYETWCRYWDEQTAEVILGSTLTTSVKGEGARAAAETHAEETNSLVDNDADGLSGTLNKTLIKWICDLNWPGAAPPSIWRPRPRNVVAEEEQKKKTEERRQSEIRTLGAARAQGYEPKDVPAWFSEVLGTEVVPVAVPETPSLKPGPKSSAIFSDPPFDFAQEVGPVDFLIDQLGELAGDPTGDWLETIRKHLGKADSFAEASKALLEIYPDLEIDPLGNVLGDAFALADLIGRSDVFDETGVYPATPRGSKKNG